MGINSSGQMTTSKGVQVIDVENPYGPANASPIPHHRDVQRGQSRGAFPQKTVRRLMALLSLIAHICRAATFPNASPVPSLLVTNNLCNHLGGQGKARTSMAVGGRGAWKPSRMHLLRELCPAPSILLCASKDIPFSFMGVVSLSLLRCPTPLFPKFYMCR